MRCAHRPACRGQRDALPTAPAFAHKLHSLPPPSMKPKPQRLRPYRGDNYCDAGGIRDTLGEIDYLCSGTLLRRTKVCGKPGCRCASDPDARHGPYFEWGHMKGGKLVHRTVSPEQAAILEVAIANHRKAKKLMQDWEQETERLLDAQAPRKP